MRTRQSDLCYRRALRRSCTVSRSVIPCHWGLPGTSRLRLTGIGVGVLLVLASPGAHAQDGAIRLADDRVEGAAAPTQLVRDASGCDPWQWTTLQEDALDTLLSSNAEAEALYDDDPDEFWRQWEDPWREVLRARSLVICAPPTPGWSSWLPSIVVEAQAFGTTDAVESEAGSRWRTGESGWQAQILVRWP
jgi:hypothetical protein